MCIHCIFHLAIGYTPMELHTPHPHFSKLLDLTQYPRYIGIQFIHIV